MFVPSVLQKYTFKYVSLTFMLDSIILFIVMLTSRSWGISQFCCPLTKWNSSWNSVYSQHLKLTVHNYVFIWVMTSIYLGFKLNYRRLRSFIGLFQILLYKYWLCFVCSWDYLKLYYINCGSACSVSSL